MSATIGGTPATVLYAGDASGLVEGVVQLNIRLPEYVYSGTVDVTVGDVLMQFSISVSGH